MTEREFLKTLARARHALALASWGVAQAAMTEDEGAEREDPIGEALLHWRKAHKALGRARARWERQQPALLPQPH
jgi:nicotinamide mononucleotide (NMN) deamidase PncC